MKIAIVALLTLHGLVHAMGFVSTWGLAHLDGVSQVPTSVISARPDDPIVRILGVVWLLALILFLIAAYLLLVNSAAWRPAAVAAVLVSMLPVALWWQDALMGAVANAMVVLAVVLVPKLEGVTA